MTDNRILLLEQNNAALSEQLRNTQRELAKAVGVIRDMRDMVAGVTRAVGTSRPRRALKIADSLLEANGRSLHSGRGGRHA